MRCYSNESREQDCLEPSNSALYIHATYDIKVTWQISSNTQCNSDTSGQLQFTWITNRFLTTILLSVFIINSICKLKLFFCIIVFYTILSYSLPKVIHKIICKVQLYKASNRYTWQCSKELMSLVVVQSSASLTCRESVGNFYVTFFTVIEVFLCCFRITRRFMLRSQNELNTTLGGEGKYFSESDFSSPIGSFFILHF